MRGLVILGLLLVSMPVGADTVYKTVGPDGRIVYSDQPPASGKVDKTLSFSNLPATPLPDSVLRYREELQKSLQARLSNAGKSVDAGLPTLFSAQWCGYCRQAKAYLAEKRIPYREYDIDTPDGMRALAEAGAGRGIPVLLRNGRKIQGFSKPAYDAVFNTP